MKLLITGFTGFVSPHFLDLLQREEPGSEVLGIDKNAPDFDFNAYPSLSIGFKQVDLLDQQATQDTLASFKPECILHLASVSSVAKSWQTPVDCFANNTNIFLHVAEAIRAMKLPTRILSVGSSEEFGIIPDHELPLTENSLLKPTSPYAVARVAQEMLSKVFADGYALDIIMTRSFNHIGPGQKEIFVISSWAKQLTMLAKTNAPDKKLITGDLSVIRDFVDVRDVVKAYYLLLKKGKRGEVYNICSGNGRMLKDIVNEMTSILNITVTTVTDPALVRPAENKKIIGSYEKIKNELGWKPSISIEKSLTDIIEYWKNNNR